MDHWGLGTGKERVTGKTSLNTPHATVSTTTTFLLGIFGLGWNGWWQSDFAPFPRLSAGSSGLSSGPWRPMLSQQEKSNSTPSDAVLASGDRRTLMGYQCLRLLVPEVGNTV